MTFGVQDLAGLIRGQLHDRTFDTWKVKILSVEHASERGTLALIMEIYDWDDPQAPSTTANFEVRIEHKR